MAEINLGTLYEFNKQAMKNEKPIDPILLNLTIKKIAENIRSDVEAYWMLLNNERNDYTIFHLNRQNFISDFIITSLANELKETLQNRGIILSIEEQKDGNYEIWIRDSITNENFVYYFFNYTNAVIEA